MTEVLADAILELMRPEMVQTRPLTRTVQELTGQPARTFAEWAAAHVAQFAG